MYLEIIRRYRRDRPGRPPATGELPNEASRADAVNALSTASAAHRQSDGPSPLRVEEVLSEIRRPGSGPAKALETYREKPNTERLGWLTKAILHARGRSTDEWEQCVPVVAEATRKLDQEDGDGKVTDIVKAAKANGQLKKGR